MKIIAYLYSDPLLEVSPNQEIWGLEIDQVYQDFGDHQQLQQLLIDCQKDKPDFLLIRRLEELGENIGIICDRLAQLESLGIKIITTEQDYSSIKWEQASNFYFTQDNDHKLNLSRLLQQIQATSQSIRLKQGHARNRLKILPPPGKAPYGYRRGQDKYIIDKSTAPVVKDFFERFLLFASLRGAVRYLEKRYGKKNISFYWS